MILLIIHLLWVTKMYSFIFLYLLSNFHCFIYLFRNDWLLYFHNITSILRSFCIRSNILYKSFSHVFFLTFYRYWNITLIAILIWQCIFNKDRNLFICLLLFLNNFVFILFFCSNFRGKQLSDSFCKWNFGWTANYTRSCWVFLLETNKILFL